MTDDYTDVAWPRGRWAVGVSGGADSVALLRLAFDAGAAVHVVHLDHQTRGADSTADAVFVADLAGKLGLPATVRTLGECDAGPSRNPSARYRHARLDLFRRVVAGHGLDGVLLAHHAADQAETVLIRLLRGGGVRSLRGMVDRTTIGGLTVARPLLDVHPAALRRHLIALGQPWREDATNATDAYLRNRCRPIAADLGDPLRHLADAARRTVDWLDAHCPALAKAFAVTALHGIPPPLARHAAGRWLAARGVPADAVNRPTCERLVALATDAATPARSTFPGTVAVRRAGGVMSAESPPRRAVRST